MNEPPEIVRHRELLAALKTLATLYAIQTAQEHGRKDDQTLRHCANAVEDLCLYFGETEKTRTDPPALQGLPSTTWLLAAAKELGLYRKEQAGNANREWLDRALVYMQDLQAKLDQQN